MFLVIEPNADNYGNASLVNSSKCTTLISDKDTSINLQFVPRFLSYSIAAPKISKVMLPLVRFLDSASIALKNLPTRPDAQAHCCKYLLGRTRNEAKPKLSGKTMSDNEQQPKEEKNDTHINLKVSDGSAEIFFKIKRSTPMRKLMDAFCKRQGKNFESMRFLIDGTRVNVTDTPDTLDLEDGDTIEAHREQVGGALWILPLTISGCWGGAHAARCHVCPYEYLCT